MHLMKVKVTRGHGVTEDANMLALGEERWEALRGSLVGLELPSWDEARPDTPEEEQAAKEDPSKRRYRWWSVEGMMTCEDAVRATEAGLKLEVSRVRGMFSEQTPEAVLKDAQLGFRPVNIDITVPGGVALTSIRRVTWLENSCTDVLQTYLSEGWRLIAVCPANDTRRPTYVVGHENPEARLL